MYEKMFTTPVCHGSIVKCQVTGVNCQMLENKLQISAVSQEKECDQLGLLIDFSSNKAKVIGPHNFYVTKKKIFQNNFVTKDLLVPIFFFFFLTKFFFKGFNKKVLPKLL